MSGKSMQKRRHGYFKLLRWLYQHRHENISHLQDSVTTTTTSSSSTIVLLSTKGKRKLLDYRRWAIK